MNLRGKSWLKPVTLAASLGDLTQAVDKVVRQLGFRYFIYHGCFPSSRTSVYEVRLDNCPDEWRKHCHERGWDGDSDPLRRCARRQVTPILWRELAPYEPAWIAGARRFGLATGVILPVHGPDEQWSSLSFVKSRGGAQAEREVWMTSNKCQFLSGFVHEAVARITKSLPDSAVAAEDAAPRSWRLSGRERDCLTWVAAGKTTFEVADVLSISERTVIFHLSNARRKLGAVNSHHAIMKAISLGVIRTL